MKIDKLNEQELRAALRQRAADVQVPQDADERLWAEIVAERRKSDEKMSTNLSIKERIYMKKFSVKLVATVCAVFALSAMTVLAASGVLGGWVGHNIAGSRVTNYAQVAEKLLPELDYAPRVVEKFSNGFDFTVADMAEFQARDDEGNTFGKMYRDLILNYENAAGEQLALYIGNEPADEAVPGVVATREVGDVLLEYREIAYMFVPPGYEVSEEDKAAEARGEMYISVGSSEVERKLDCGVRWTVDGVNYNLFGWDLSLGAEEMLDMAEEVLAAE